MVLPGENDGWTAVCEILLRNCQAAGSETWWEGEIHAGGLQRQVMGINCEEAKSRILIFMKMKSERLLLNERVLWER